jgi:hypothetical protein
MRFARRLVAEDRALAAVVLAHMVLQFALATWDLPGAHGWENDAIAPRDLFGGLAENLTPGHAHRYPLLQYVLVAVTAAPVLGFAALDAASFARPDLEAAFITVPVMTGISVAAKGLTVLMTAVTLLILGRIGRRLDGTATGRAAVVLAMLNLSLAYYGRTSNLDAPYLMWTVLALDRLLHVVDGGARRDAVLAGLAMAAAVATKDQAYAAFVLVVPAYLVVLPALGGSWHAARKLLGLVLGSAIAGYLVLAGPVFNPTGFVHRIGVITGPNNRDWQTYTPDVVGLGANLTDVFANQAAFWWPWPVVFLSWAGVLLASARRPEDGPHDRALRLLPFVAGLGSLLMFSLVVRRCEHRFVLPLGLLLCPYGGLAAVRLARLLATRGRRVQRVALVPALVVIAMAIAPPLSLALTQAGDARVAVERFLKDQAPDVVETYGPLVYLPRFESSRHQVRRVGPESPRGRNPLLGATEVQARYETLDGNPGFLVIPTAFTARFQPAALGPGRKAPDVWSSHRADVRARAFFAQAEADRLPGYRAVLQARPRLPGWAAALGLRPVDLHASVGQRVVVLKRTHERSPEPQGSPGAQGHPSR